MSRIGIKPIQVPNNVTITLAGNKITAKGPKGEQSIEVHPRLAVNYKENEIVVERKSELKMDKSLHGLSRTLVQNLVMGVEKGFEKKLEIIGVGFKAQVQGSKLILNLGFSHPIEFNSPKGIVISMDPEKKNILIINGIDKQLVGETAAKIRGYKKPEPYKGKGIRYVGEFVARKAGKAAGKDK